MCHRVPAGLSGRPFCCPEISSGSNQTGNQIGIGGGDPVLTLTILFAGLFVGLIGAGLVGLAVESYAEKQSRKEKIKAAILRLKDERKAG